MESRSKNSPKAVLFLNGHLPHLWCMVVQQQFGNWEGKAHGGSVARLKLLPIDAVIELIPPTQLPVAGRPMTVSGQGLLITEGSVITELVFPPQQCVFSEVQQSSPDGISYSLSLTTAIPMPTAEFQAWLHDNQERRFLAIWLDALGQAYVGGEPERGLMLTITRALNNRSTIQIALTGTGLHPGWYLESYANTVLFPDSEFDLSFDSSFS